MSVESAEKRKIVLGVTGSIAAYKAAELARLLVTRGFEVRVVMTQAGAEFVTPLTMQSITGSAVMSGVWSESESEGIGHIELADWADALVIAPATADFIAKYRAGMSDTPLLAVALATKAPILMAPAMNVNMYENPLTQENIQALKTRGVSFVDPGEGALACGWNGTGRLAEPEDIFHHVRRVLSVQDFKAKRILITTGPTREAIDPVRFISNRSSGKMGVALALEAFRRGAEVTLVHGPVRVDVPDVFPSIPVVSATEMQDAVLSRAFPIGAAAQGVDVVIMAAAVSDYRPKQPEGKKIKKSNKVPSIELVHNPDILLELGQKRKKTRKPILVGFAVETGELEDLLAETRKKLAEKGTDLMVGNFADDAFDLDTNKVWLVDRNGKQEEVSTTYKSRVANKILDAILKL